MAGAQPRSCCHSLPQEIVWVAKSANPNILFLPKESGGLGLALITSLYKGLQVSRQAQLLASTDPSVRRIAEIGYRLKLWHGGKKFAQQLSPVTPYSRTRLCPGRH